MDFTVTGTIEQIKEAVSGTSAAGKEWTRQEFIVNTGEEYDNIYCFTVFGEERVERLNKFNAVGDRVDVTFNIKTREHEGRHFCNLQAWKIFKAEDQADIQKAQRDEVVSGMDNGDDLPF